MSRSMFGKANSRNPNFYLPSLSPSLPPYQIIGVRHVFVQVGGHLLREARGRIGAPPRVEDIERVHVGLNHLSGEAREGGREGGREGVVSTVEALAFVHK